MTEAGTPALNRHVPRQEAQARIEAALVEARTWAEHIGRVGWSDHTAGLGLGALQRIIRILEDGKS